MNNNNSNNKMYMYVLSIKDVQNIRKCNYYQAKSEFYLYDYFYINSKPYILASDYFGEKRYEITNVSCYQSIENNIDTKIIKIMPQMYTVQDIQLIFGCGQRQAYEIMDLIPGTFKINSKRYVQDEKLREWLDSLPNKKLSIA